MSSSLTRRFPNPVAVFTESFVFSTLTSGEVAMGKQYPYAHPQTGKACLVLSLDEEMHYMPFAQDYGPLNLAYTFKACLMIHEKYRASEDKLKTVCVYTLPNSRRKANIALMVSLYFLIVWHWQPSAAFAPLAHMEFRLFRDASSGQMDFGLSIQDILWGVYKAINFDLLDLEHFDPRYYRYYETVDNGDLNILGPFIPFASPMDPKWIEASRSEKNKHAEDIDKAASLTKSLIETAQNRRHAYRCILEVFQEQLVGLVVRLNEDLYDRKTFLEFGMEHVDLYFDDGSNPTDEIVERFIGMAEEFIERRRQKVAVHCKAGLGRTGVLIGAYLIYKYQFTATEVIGYMRLVRPGMVVGPQQQYMVENQMKWAGWAARDALTRDMARQTLNPPISQLATPPMESDEPTLGLALIDDCLSSENEVSHLLSGRSALEMPVGSGMTRPSTVSVANAQSKDGDAIGQPRKSPSRAPIRKEENGDSAPPTPDEIRIKTPSPVASDELESGSMRGTKRDATRLPVSQPSTDSSSGASSRLLAIQSLSRSDSVVSLASSHGSANDRPTKRRGVPEVSSNPLSSHHPIESTGLSSPPPSREGSPMENSLSQDTRLPLSPSRIANKLRRRVSPSPQLKPDRVAQGDYNALRSPPPSAIPISQGMRSQLKQPTVYTSRRIASSSPKADSASRKEKTPIPSPTRDGHKRTVDPGQRTPDIARSRRAMDLGPGEVDRGQFSPRRIGVTMTPPRFAREFISRMGNGTSRGP